MTRSFQRAAATRAKTGPAGPSGPVRSPRFAPARRGGLTAGSGAGFGGGFGMGEQLSDEPAGRFAASDGRPTGDRPTGDRPAAGSGSFAGDRVAAARTAGGGRPVPGGLRRPLERAYGSSFGAARLHDSGPADALARSLDARAVTHGSDVFFRRGALQPDSAGGQRLIAHELAHVAQQQGAVDAAPAAAALSPSTPNHPAEQRARRAADAVMAGRPAPPVGEAPADVLLRQNGEDAVQPNRKRRRNEPAFEVEENPQVNPELLVEVLTLIDSDAVADVITLSDSGEADVVDELEGGLTEVDDTMFDVEIEDEGRLLELAEVNNLIPERKRARIEDEDDEKEPDFDFGGPGQNFGPPPPGQLIQVEASRPHAPADEPLVIGPNFGPKLRRLSGRGDPLPGPLRRSMEDRLGGDFAAVRIHRDAQADLLTRGLGADALTAEGQLFFRRGMFDPQTPSGKQLLAHELTHVVQTEGKSGGPPPSGGQPARLGRRTDPAEREARRVASAVAADRPAPPIVQRPAPAVVGHPHVGYKGPRPANTAISGQNGSFGYKAVGATHALGAGGFAIMGNLNWPGPSMLDPAWGKGHYNGWAAGGRPAANAIVHRVQSGRAGVRNANLTRQFAKKAAVKAWITGYCKASGYPVVGARLWNMHHTWPLAWDGEDANRNLTPLPARNAGGANHQRHSAWHGTLRPAPPNKGLYPRPFGAHWQVP